MNNEILIEDDATFTAPAPARRFEPSTYQAAIFSWITAGTGDAIVNAVAGSGKTTTLVEASKLLPSGASAMFCAFNAHIVKELTSRLSGMECKTIHGIGLSTLTRHFDKQPTVDGNKYRNLVRKEAWRLGEQMPTVNRTDLVSALGGLVNLCHATLTSDPATFSDPFGVASGHIAEKRAESLQELVSHFGLTLPCPVDQIAPSVHSVLRAGILQASEEHVISFSDMLWLPWVWGLQPRTYDWVFVDECQDLNRAQLEMVLKLRRDYHKPTREVFRVAPPTGRMIFVGDPRQAIYGFSGADATSYANIKERTQATEFPLSVSYRCPVLVVREAQAIVPGIQPRPGAPLGTVRWISETDLYANVKEGDLLLCRMTAPLIATCLDLIRQKVPARVRGKDIGKMLVKTVNVIADQHGFVFSEFPRCLRTYTDEQVNKLRKRDDQESAIERAYDIDAALLACFQGLGVIQPELERTVSQHAGIGPFRESIERLFSDDRPGVWLSTVHKAKGLEAARVFILRPDRLPIVWRGQQAWEHEQEMNLKYVAITRSLDELVYVRQAGETI